MPVHTLTWTTSIPRHTDEMDSTFAAETPCSWRRSLRVFSRRAPSQFARESHHAGSGRVTVSTASEKFTADSCIFAAPSSVLNSIQLRSAALSRPKRSQQTSSSTPHHQNADALRSPLLAAEDFSLMSDETSHRVLPHHAGTAGTDAAFCAPIAVGDKADVLASQTKADRQFS